MVQVAHTDCKALLGFMPWDSPSCGDCGACTTQCLLPGLKEESEAPSGFNLISNENNWSVSIL